MINSHKVTKHACTSSWLPLAHSIHHTYHQVTVMNKQQKKQRLLTTHMYIHISCKCDTNRAGHFTLDAHASRPVACILLCAWNKSICFTITKKRIKKSSLNFLYIGIMGLWLNSCKNTQNIENAHGCLTGMFNFRYYLRQKAYRDLKMAAILKILKYQIQLQFDLRYEIIVPNNTKNVFFMVMTSPISPQGDLKFALYIHV